REHLRVEAFRLVANGEQDGAAYEVRVTRRDLERDAPAERVTEHVDAFMAERPNDVCHVVGHLAKVDRTVSEARPAVPVQFDRDHFVRLREGRDIPSEYLDRSKPAVEHEQGIARAVDLVVVVDALAVDVAVLTHLS